LNLQEINDVYLLGINASGCGFEKTVTDSFSSVYEVTGSEDANVYFYDLARPKNSCVNKLQVCVVLNLFVNILSFYVASLRHQRDHLYS
jgi:hypothetical protein